MKKYDIVVIGGGPAGITLAKILGNKKHIAVIRPEDHSMIYCAMPYVIEGLIEHEKTHKTDSLVTGSGATLIRGTVAEINFDKKELHMSDSSCVSYDKIVMATGANPFIPLIPGRDLKGVLGFKTEKDLRRISGLVEQGLKKAVVVGAGAIGMELALALHSKDIEVDLVDMGESILPNLIDKELAEGLHEEIRQSGINLHLHAKVTELKGSETVDQVILDNGQAIHLDSREGLSGKERGNRSNMVVFAAGMVPDISLVKDSSLKTGKDGIIVNDKMETSIPDVYAAGDCVQFSSGITGEVVPGKLATNAVPMAKVIGHNLLGQNRTYPGFFNGAATKVFDHYIGGTGLSERTARQSGHEVVCGFSEVTTQFPIMPEAKKMRIKLVADKNSHGLLGGQIISGEPVTSQIDLLTFAIQKKATIEDLAELSYSAQPYQSFYPAANLVVLAAEDILQKIEPETL
ncbi:MAG: FAD-dependent oxidoreductase [Deltaproteobacteria bacterium]|nr:FAD-dependent oxidoreductase [Deltaproteobacteria bacterium]